MRRAHSQTSSSAVATPLRAAAAAKFKQWASARAGYGLVNAMAWAVVLVMVIPQGFDYAGINGVPTSSDMISKLAWMFLLFGSAAILAQRWTRVKEVVRWINPWLFLFMALALASMLWSLEPAITLRRVIRATTVIGVCLAFVVVGWEPKRFSQLLRSLFTFIMVASIVFVLVDPDNAIHHSEQPELKDAWHGITMGKNLLGSLAAMGVVIWVTTWASKEVSPFKCALGMSLNLFCLLMTRSHASILSTLFALCLLGLLLRSPNSLKRSMPYLVGFFAAAVLIYSLAVLGLVQGLDIVLKPIMAMTGKDMSFSGRTAIWDIIKEQIHLHPWLGGGYGAYWVGVTPTSPSFEMLTRLYFYPTEGHNGYLDVINDLGWVGCGFLLAYFASYIKQSLALMKIDRYQGAMYLALIFRGFLADMSESHWFNALSVDFVLLTFATTNLGRHLFYYDMYKNAAGKAPTRGW